MIDFTVILILKRLTEMYMENSFAIQHRILLHFSNFQTALKSCDEKGCVKQNDVISWHPKCPKSRMRHCNNHLKLLSNIKEIQQMGRDAWMNTNGQD